MPVQIENSSNRIEKNSIVGIDLGTTNSLVAIVEDGKPYVIPSASGHRLLPSIVSLIQDQPIVGDEAKKKKVRDAEHTIFSVKRLLGRDFKDIQSVIGKLPYEVLPAEGIAKVKVGSRSYTAIEISAMILKELKKIAEEKLGTPVSQAVITVPAYFNDSQRQATRVAGRLAGLDVLRIINEPTAASLAFGLDKKKQGLIAVYDLGGGTFDISILKLHEGVFEVLSTHGDTALGGDDFDLAIAHRVRQEIEQNWGFDPFSDSQVHAALLESAEKVKIELSKKRESLFEAQIRPGEIFQRKWTRDEFESLALPILEKTREPCLQALEDAGIQAKDLSDVILVGGPTRLSILQKWVKDFFGRDPNTSVHPDEVVAQGAAIQADILSGNNKDLLLLDVVPLSLGLETYGGLMSPIIPRNSRIPTVARESFTTFVDNQTGVDIHVLQGEREKAQDNRSLARFKLTGIQPMPAGMPRVEVTFLIDADGILQVAAKDLKTGYEQSIEVKPSYGLTEKEVEEMLMAGMEYAPTDLAFRRLTEARNQAEPILRATERSLRLASHQISEEELQLIRNAVIHLQKVFKQEDPQKIYEATEQLNHVTVRLAEHLIKETLVAQSKR